MPSCPSFLTAVLLGILKLTVSTTSKIYMALLILQVKVFLGNLPCFACSAWPGRGVGARLWSLLGKACFWPQRSLISRSPIHALGWQRLLLVRFFAGLERSR